MGERGRERKEEREYLRGRKRERWHWREREGGKKKYILRERWRDR